MQQIKLSYMYMYKVLKDTIKNAKLQPARLVFIISFQLALWETLPFWVLKT